MCTFWLLVWPRLCAGLPFWINQQCDTGSRLKIRLYFWFVEFTSIYLDFLSWSFFFCWPDHNVCTFNCLTASVVRKQLVDKMWRKSFDLSRMRSNSFSDCSFYSVGQVEIFFLNKLLSSHSSSAFIRYWPIESIHCPASFFTHICSSEKSMHVRTEYSILWPVIALFCCCLLTGRLIKSERS